jgi:SagB-type dehydrogenase family enzyme
MQTMVIPGMVLVVLAAQAPASAEGRDLPAALALPPPARGATGSIEELLRSRRSTRRFRDEPLALSEVAQLLWSAQGVVTGDGRRTAPSAGALYPLEVLLVAGEVEGLPPGIYRYRPAEHRLVPMSAGDHRGALATAALGQAWVRQAPASIVLAAVVERTAKKYGSRAERYVHMEVGSAAENVYLQAGALGLGAVLVGAFDDRRLAQAVGLEPGESPLAVIPVGRR